MTSQINQFRSKQQLPFKSSLKANSHHHQDVGRGGAEALYQKLINQPTSQPGFKVVEQSKFSLFIRLCALFFVETPRGRVLSSRGLEELAPPYQEHTSRIQLRLRLCKCGCVLPAHRDPTPHPTIHPRGANVRMIA